MVDDVQIPKINKVVKGWAVKGQIGYGKNLKRCFGLQPSQYLGAVPMKIQLKYVLGTSWDRFGGGKMLQLTVSHAA